MNWATKSCFEVELGGVRQIVETDVKGSTSKFVLGESRYYTKCPKGILVIGHELLLHGQNPA
jgi:hypothetical protein